MSVTFYVLDSAVVDEPAVVDPMGRRDRLVDYFVLGGDGRFLSFMTPRARAQPGRWNDNLGRLDVVTASSPIPLFSARFRDAVGDEIGEDVEFHECIVEAGGVEYPFFAGRTRRQLDLVDPDASTVRTRADGSTSITVPAARPRRSGCLDRPHPRGRLDVHHDAGFLR